MTLIRTSVLNGIAVLVKMLAMLGLNKVLAVYVGPVGYAVIGQFQNAIQMSTVFAAGAVNTGVTKYTAEYHGNEARQVEVWRTAGSISITGGLVSSFCIFIFRVPLAEVFLNDASYAPVFSWFSAGLVFFVLNAFLLAILNGRKELARYVSANIVSSCLALVITAFLAIQEGLFGALVALAIYQSVAFLGTLCICLRADWLKLGNLFGRIDKQIAVNLLKYTGMALTSAVCLPLSHMLVRGYVGESLGWGSAGYWEAMTRLSNAYIMFFTATLSVYFLPRFSELKKPAEIYRELFLGYKFILPACAFASFFVWLFRVPLTELLFSGDFQGMAPLFFWQMFGDMMKISSWLLSYVLLGQALYKPYIVSEIIFSMSFVLLVIVMLPVLGIEALSLAHFINYAMYFLVMAAIVRYYLRNSARF